MDENEISSVIVDAALKVHTRLGPGLLESAYEAALGHELEERGLHVEYQVPISVNYEARQLDVGFRADLIANHRVIIELKSIERVLPVHKKQLLSYLRLADLRLGLLLNFGEEHLRNGITRLANHLK